MTECTFKRYEQLETSPETIEQELRHAVCEHRQTDTETDRLKEYLYMLYSCKSWHNVLYLQGDSVKYFLDNVGRIANKVGYYDLPQRFS